MHYLTKRQFADLNGISRQAVNDRIERGTLVLAEVPTKEKRIPVEDAEYEKMLQQSLARRKGQA